MKWIDKILFGSLSITEYSGFAYLFDFFIVEISAQGFPVLRLQTIVDVFWPPSYWLLKKKEKTNGRRGLLVFFFFYSNSSRCSFVLLPPPSLSGCSIYSACEVILSGKYYWLKNLCHLAVSLRSSAFFPLKSVFDTSCHLCRGQFPVMYISPQSLWETRSMSVSWDARLLCHVMSIYF